MEEHEGPFCPMVALVCLLDLGVPILNIMHMFVCGLSLLLGLVSHGPGMVAFRRVAP